MWRHAPSLCRCLPLAVTPPPPFLTSRRPDLCAVPRCCVTVHDPGFVRPLLPSPQGRQELLRLHVAAGPAVATAAGAPPTPAACKVCTRASQHAAQVPGADSGLCIECGMGWKVYVVQRWWEGPALVHSSVPRAGSLPTRSAVSHKPASTTAGRRVLSLNMEAGTRWKASCQPMCLYSCLHSR